MIAQFPHDQRLLIVSNRLPVVLRRGDNGAWQIEPGSGGLINALAPVLRDRGGLWIGWPGTTEEDALDLDALLAEATQASGYLLKPVSLTATQRDKFYLGFANEIVWPLFHDLQSRCHFDPSYWTMYLEVNRTFAQVVAAQAHSNDYIWVHDYHLMHVARELRALGIDAPIGFFLHIPFPPLDIFLKLPWRDQVLRALLDYDLIGFQTARDRQNFVQCIRVLVNEATVYSQGPLQTVQLGAREIRLGSFPISIDARMLAQRAASAKVVAKMDALRERLADQQLILGVDRLDYTKGIPERLEAFRLALERYPELHERVVLQQIVVPSRTDIRAYDALKVRIEQLVGEINGRFTRAGWVPVHYHYRRLSLTELVALYRTSEIALVTPLKDGMNLVAKEYCVCSLDGGVLILSEFAGAATELGRDALLVNPYDVEGMAQAIWRAWQMPPNERRRRMDRLRGQIHQHDIFWWVDSLLEASIAHDLDDFPIISEPASRR
jgi:trehalose 6-phosphate synthase/phosphatase